MVGNRCQTARCWKELPVLGILSSVTQYYDQKGSYCRGLVSKYAKILFTTVHDLYTIFWTFTFKSSNRKQGVFLTLRTTGRRKRKMFAQQLIQMQVQYFRGIPRTAIARKHRTASEPSNPRACGCWAWGALRLTRKMLKVCWCLLSCVWRMGNAATHFFMRYKHIIGEANTLDPWLFKSWPFANQNLNILKKMEADRIYRYH